LDVLLNIDADGKLTPQLYDKTGWFQFYHCQLPIYTEPKF
jgi:hypothetical protein